MGSFQTPISMMQFYDRQGSDATESVIKELKEKCPQILEMVGECSLFKTTGQGALGMATQYNVPFWGNLPLDSALLKSCEEGKAFVDACPNLPAAKTLTDFASRLTKACPVDMSSDATK
jgi:hypothetical protein